MSRAPAHLKPVASESAPPHSIAAEENVIGGLLLEPAAWETVAGVCTAADFYVPYLRVAFAVITKRAEAGRPFDVVLLEDELEREGKLAEVGGRTALKKLVADTAGAVNIKAYAETVVEHARRRRLLELFTQGERGIAPGAGAAQVVETLEANLQSLRPPRTNASLSIAPASTWASREAPAPRDWIIKDLVPAGRVTSFLGDGGLGKTQVAVQFAVHIALGLPIFGLEVSGGPVLGIFCEDEQEELERRARAACAGEQLELGSLERLHMLSRDGEDNLLCTFEREQIAPTPFYRELEATIAALKPRLTILDTAADLFGGDFMSTPQVRQFLKVALGGLCVRHKTAILLLAHPSASGIASGDGGGFSTAWNNSVRSRLYLRRPKTEDAEAARDRRVVEVRKSNYAAVAAPVALAYQRGYFVPDPEPIDEGARPARASRTDTRLAVAVLARMRQIAPSGTVASFRQLFEPLQAAGDIPAGNYETVRKLLQRTLRQLTQEGLLIETKIPRGYRLAESKAQEAA